MSNYVAHEAPLSAQILVDLKSPSLGEDVFDCPLCQSLLYEPITTSCGHTFCRDCILRAMDHDNKCPMCRTVVHVTPEYGVAVILNQIIQHTFPLQYKQRQEEKGKELSEQTFNMPLFLLGQLVLFPKTSLPLHVFEPRYRLMIRRCLEGSHRFGVVPHLNNGLAPIGCTAQIENHYVFPDGRSLVATTGEKRFKIISLSEQDGYKVAKIEYFEDEPLSEDGRSRLQDKFRLAKDLVNTHLAAALPQVEEKVGKMPQTNAVDFGWWLAGVVPISAEEKYSLLSCVSAEQRLDILSRHLSEMASSSEGKNCNIS